MLITKSTCAGAKGKICVIVYSYEDVLPWKVSNQAEKSGCIGVIAFSTMETESVTSQFDDELLIPCVHVGKEEGLSILNGKIGTTSSIQGYKQCCLQFFLGIEQVLLELAVCWCKLL
jgi:hypothetical protein